MQWVRELICRLFGHDYNAGPLRDGRFRCYRCSWWTWGDVRTGKEFRRKPTKEQ